VTEGSDKGQIGSNPPTTHGAQVVFTWLFRPTWWRLSQSRLAGGFNNRQCL